MVEYILSNGNTISFPEIEVSCDCTFEEIKETVSKFTSPIKFRSVYPDLMKIIFNNKWFNMLFPKFTPIEKILENSMSMKSRKECNHTYRTIYKLLHILGDTVCDVIFGKVKSHRHNLYKNLKDERLIQKIQAKYKNRIDLYTNSKEFYNKLKYNNLLDVYFPEDKHDIEYRNEQTCLDVAKLFNNIYDLYNCFRTVMK